MRVHSPVCLYVDHCSLFEHPEALAWVALKRFLLTPVSPVQWRRLALKPAPATVWMSIRRRARPCGAVRTHAPQFAPTRLSVLPTIETPTGQTSPLQALVNVKAWCYGHKFVITINRLCFTAWSALVGAKFKMLILCGKLSQKRLTIPSLNLYVYQLVQCWILMCRLFCFAVPVTDVYSFKQIYVGSVDNTYERECASCWFTVKGISWRSHGKWCSITGRYDIKRLLFWQLCSLRHTWSMLQLGLVVPVDFDKFFI